MKHLTTIIALLLCCCIQAVAKVTLPSWFTDNMVMQQEAEITIKGKAKAKKTLKLTTGWDNQTLTTKVAADGSWELKVKTPKAGGPYTLTFNDGKKLVLNNVMIGEVWFCSGQSNMEMPVAGWGQVLNYKEEIANANHPQIRLFQVKKNTSPVPLDDVEVNNGGWQECSPASIPEFSSLAYFYARELQAKTGVAIGVIDATWGGTPAESWTSFETIKKVAGFEQQTQLLEGANFDRNALDAIYNEQLSAWQNNVIARDGGYADGKALWAEPSTDVKGWPSMPVPAGWEKSGMENFDGIVWMRYSVDIPAAWAGKALTLRLGMIDDEDITYWNGAEIARGWGYNQQRTYGVAADKVKAGENVITVRVSDFGGGGGIYGEESDLYVECNGEKISLAGEWKYNVAIDIKTIPTRPVSPTSNNWFPTSLYNAMVSPLTDFAIRGAIWYQGEANEDRAEQYGTLFPAMIQDWRNKWGYEFPFYFVQLANFRAQKLIEPDTRWAFLRESQADALQLAQTGMVVNIDLGEGGDIHPKNKQAVGKRLAALALKNTYNQNVIANPPAYKGHEIEGDKVIISFDSPDGQVITAKGGTVEGFIIAGADHIFYPAKAEIINGKVVVSSPEVKDPLAVRYAWADNPVISLYGNSGLPVSPFRTDRWKK